MDISAKKKENKLMNWFKETRNSIIHKNNDVNKSKYNPSTPSMTTTRRYSNDRNGAKQLKKPQLKFANSLDERNLMSSKIRKPDNNHNKCYSELNKKQYALYWMEINDINKCNSSIMTFEANQKCVENNKCGPCKRLHFILEYCPYDSSNLSVSSFMNGLAGYSHIQLTKDFRHLQIFHSKSKQTEKIIKKKNKHKKNVDFSDTKSLLKHIYNTLSKYDMNMNIDIEIADDADNVDNNDEDKQSVNILTAVSKLMMELETKKDFNGKYMKLGLISKGANGKIYAIKSWKKNEFYAMKEICFKNLNINILYEILRNWRMVQTLNLIGNDTEMYVDSNKMIFLIVQHLYKGSMCELLKDTYLNKHRCLTENELKNILKNGVLHTLSKMHCNGYIHGDIKPENIVYEMMDKNIKTAIIDYDLCTRYTLNVDDDDDDDDDDHDHDEQQSVDGIYCEWRGTLGYSAPEWIPYKRIKSKITPKVDIYSLGLTMLILLCGEQPFLCPTAVKQKLQKENPMINIKQFVYETMMNNGEFMISHFLKKLSTKISNDLYQLLQSMLIFDPQQRFDIDQVINHKWFN